MTQKNFAAAINEALHEAMQQDTSVICYGLGVTDPKAVFGTTSNLEQRFGSERVFDMPTSENAMTGVAIGAALNGIKSVITHQRIDFFLLAMDQIVNGAAKLNVPIYTSLEESTILCVVLVLLPSAYSFEEASMKLFVIVKSVTVADASLLIP